MITINGQMTLCNLSMAMTSNGTAQLTIEACAPNPAKPDGVRYVLLMTGTEAACFYTDFGHALKIGAELWVNATEPRPLVDRGENCLMANILGIEVLKQGTKPVIKAGAHYTPRPLIKSRWINLEGVTA